MVIKVFYNLVNIGVPALTLCLNCHDCFLIIVKSYCGIGKVRPSYWLSYIRSKSHGYWTYGMQAFHAGCYGFTKQRKSHSPESFCSSFNTPGSAGLLK